MRYGQFFIPYIQSLPGQSHTDLICVYYIYRLRPLSYNHIYPHLDTSTGNKKSHKKNGQHDSIGTESTRGFSSSKEHIWKCTKWQAVLEGHRPGKICGQEFSISNITGGSGQCKWSN